MQLNNSLSWRGSLLALCLLAIPAALHADTVYDNLGSTSSGTDAIGIDGPLSDSFSTGDTSFSFSTLTVPLSTSDNTGSVTASLLSDSSGTPGSVIDTIGTVSDSALGSDLSDYTFSLSTPFVLLPGTTYWIQLSSDDGGSADWSWSIDQSGQGVAGQFFSNIGGVFPSSDGPYQMQVGNGQQPVSTPEPGVMPMLGIGLAFVVFLARKRFLTRSA